MNNFILSKYNFYIEYEKRVIYFNGISRAVFSVDQREHMFIQSQLADLSVFQSKYPVFFQFFLDGYFIIEHDLNELDYIRQLNNRDIFLDPQYRIMINPTLECNFNCWYCYEKHPQGHMSEDVKNKIINHMRYVAEYKGIKGIDLSWFGGEPFLYFREVVYPISKAFQEIATQYSLKFSNHITTNAYLIDDSMIALLNEISLYSFQITIDGDERKHDTIRHEKKLPSFRKIISNINMLLKQIERVSIILRINYDDKTLDTIVDVFEMFPQEFRNRIQISFNRVWQTLSNDNKECKESVARLNNLIQLAIAKGYKCSYADDIPRNFRRCHCDKYWNTEINYDGKIYKCTMDYSEETQGVFLDSGEIEWNKKIVSMQYSKATFENESCLNCKLLPICLGPCSGHKLRSEGKLNCNMNASELPYQDIIINYYLSKKIKSEGILK